MLILQILDGRVALHNGGHLLQGLEHRVDPHRLEDGLGFENHRHGESVVTLGHPLLDGFPVELIQLCRKEPLLPHPRCGLAGRVHQRPQSCNLLPVWTERLLADGLFQEQLQGVHRGKQYIDHVGGGLKLTFPQQVQDAFHFMGELGQFLVSHGARHAL